MYFFINAKLPSLNEYILACRRNKYAGAKFKSDIENLIGQYIYAAIAAGDIKPVTRPVEIRIKWNEATKRRDVDNIQSAQKYILDALQKTSVLKGDGRKYVKQVYHEVIDSESDYVLVQITEV